ncbi:hypothetical protein GCM10010169_45930 [Micromonospora fulviviridis]|uniref:hypothetical protein n=1 Tax=Micromonospora fulviviridis TaxID=47860 RepID=UPI0019C0CEEC|nr:hypothetical protein [Micromonospora fulviviridis]GGR96210.1 hypothetical protein GCM10010169_45930 [Micromonospora fulviviridis]
MSGQAVDQRERLTTHGPVLPVWSCGSCAAPWPCAAGRQQLRAEFADAPVSLALYLGAQLVRASADLHWLPAGALHRRFLGWVR